MNKMYSGVFPDLSYPFLHSPYLQLLSFGVDYWNEQREARIEWLGSGEEPGPRGCTDL